MREPDADDDRRERQAKSSVSLTEHSHVDRPSFRRDVARVGLLVVERVINDAALICEAHCLGPVGGIQLAVDVREVELDRLFGYEELPADRLVGETARKRLDDPDLPRSSTRGAWRRPRLSWRWPSRTSRALRPLAAVGWPALGSPTA